jgi:CelD/BcsL family acetyltransferase involved in cellulose biosynthesis
MPVAYREVRRREYADSSILALEEITDLERFRAVGPHWVQLFNRLADRIPFLSHEWLETWCEAFVSRPLQLKIMLVWENGRLEAAAPLVAAHRTLWGIPVSTIESAGNLHTPCFEWLLPADRDPEPLVARIFERLLSESPDVILLKDLRRESPTTAAIRRFAAERRLAVGVENQCEAPYVRISGEWNQYLEQRSKHFRSTLARYERQWRELGGTLDVVDDADADRVGVVLEEGLALEASGWKGREGTAILDDPQVASFYRALVSRLAGSGQLRQYVLRQHGRAVAWDLCLRYERNAYGLKKAYDETYRSSAPGFELQRQELMTMFQDHDLGAWHLLAPQDDVKKRWCDRSIEQLSLRIYTNRRLRARLAYLVHGRVRPRLKRSRLYAFAKAIICNV